MHAAAHKDIVAFLRMRYPRGVSTKLMTTRDATGGPQWLLTVEADAEDFVVSWSPDQGLRLQTVDTPMRAFSTTTALCEAVFELLGAPLELHGLSPEIVTRLGVTFEPCREHPHWPREHHRFTFSN